MKKNLLVLITTLMLTVNLARRMLKISTNRKKMKICRQKNYTRTLKSCFTFFFDKKASHFLKHKMNDVEGLVLNRSLSFGHYPTENCSLINSLYVFILIR